VPNSIIEQRITGALLGDAHLEKKSLTANARLRYEQSIKHSARFYHFFNLLALMCAGNAVERKRFDNRTGKTYGSLYFATRSLPILTEFYQLFYLNKVKVIPLNIASLITPITLAQWIADDGFFRYGLALQTDSYTINEVTLLIEALRLNFGIESRVRLEKQKPVIYIPASQMDLVRSIVLQHLDPSTYYKVGLGKI